jgi:hypothetical protein
VYFVELPHHLVLYLHSLLPYLLPQSFCTVLYAPIQVWVAQYAPHMSVYTPVYVAAGPEAVPSPLSTGNLFRYDPKSTFWQACSVGNWAAQAFKYAIVDVRAAQQALEQQVLSEQVGLFFFSYVFAAFSSFYFCILALNFVRRNTRLFVLVFFSQARFPQVAFTMCTRVRCCFYLSTSRQQRLKLTLRFPAATLPAQAMR